MVVPNNLIKNTHIHEARANYDYLECYFCKNKIEAGELYANTSAFVACIPCLIRALKQYVESKENMYILKELQSEQWLNQI